MTIRWVIRASVSEVQKTLLEGCILAVLVVFRLPAEWGKHGYQCNFTAHLDYHYLCRYETDELFTQQRVINGPFLSGWDCLIR